MSLLFGARPQLRSWTADPVIPPNSATGTWGNGQLSLHNTESSLQKVAVFASVNLIAGVCSMLPLDALTGKGAAKRPVDLPAFFTATDGSGQGIEDWLYQGLWCALLRGNAMGEILDFDKTNRPVAVQLWHPDYVRVIETSGGPQWTYRGTQVPADRVWHRRVFPRPGARLGLSPIALHATTIGQGLAATEFGLRWFQDGAHPSAILTNKDATEIAQSEAMTIKSRFLAAVRGTREPVVLSGGWDYTAIQIAANESQFLETQKYTAAECARIFGPGMPETLGYETGGPLTYNTPELRGIELLKFSLNRWLVWVERFLTRDFMPPGTYVKFNRGALLETDLKTRFDAHAVALDKGWTDTTEIRGLEDMSPPAVASDVKAAQAAQALNLLVRAGFEPVAAALALGLDPIAHTGLVPITMSLPSEGERP